MRFLNGMGIIGIHKKALAASVSFRAKDFLAILYDVIFFLSLAPLFYSWLGVVTTRVESVSSIDFFGVTDLNELALLDAQSRLLNFIVFFFISLLVYFAIALLVYVLLHVLKWNLILKKKFSKELFRCFYFVSFWNLLPWFMLFILLIVFFQERGLVLFGFLYILGFYFHSLGKLLVYHHRSVKAVLKDQYVLGVKKIAPLSLVLVLVGVVYYLLFSVLGMLFSVEVMTLFILGIYGFVAIIVRKYFQGVVDQVR